MKEVTGKMIAGKTGNASYSFQGVKKGGRFRSPPLSNWYIGMAQNYDELTAPAHSLRNLIVLMGVIFLILTSVAVIFFSRSITLPIKRAIETYPSFCSHQMRR